MRLPKFEYSAPERVDDVCRLLDKYGDAAAVIAGGTDLLIRMKQRIISPKYLVDLKSISQLYGMSYDGSALKIGPLTKIGDLERSSVLKQLFPGLSVAAKKVATAQIRNMGTIGGNICLGSKCYLDNRWEFWGQRREPCLKRGGRRCYVSPKSSSCIAPFKADTVPIMIALEGRLELRSASERREIALEEFYSGDGASVTVLRPGEILTQIQIPKPLERTASVYLKYSLRKSIDFPLIGIAVKLALDQSYKVCTDIRIVMGGLNASPIRAHKAESTLIGKEITNEGILDASEKVSEEIAIYPGEETSLKYQRTMLRIIVEQTIQQAFRMLRL